MTQECPVGLGRWLFPHKSSDWPPPCRRAGPRSSTTAASSRLGPAPTSQRDRPSWSPCAMARCSGAPAAWGCTGAEGSSPGPDARPGCPRDHDPMTEATVLQPVSLPAVVPHDAPIVCQAAVSQFSYRLASSRSGRVFRSISDSRAGWVSSASAASARVICFWWRRPLRSVGAMTNGSSRTWWVSRAMARLRQRRISFLVGYYNPVLVH